MSRMFVWSLNTDVDKIKWALEIELLYEKKKCYFLAWSQVKNASISWLW